MNKTESILVELFDKYPQLTTAEIIEHTALARRTIQKYLTHLVNEEVKKAWDNIHNPKYKNKLKKALEQFIKKWSKKQNHKGSEVVLEYVERAKRG